METWIRKTVFLLLLSLVAPSLIVPDSARAGQPQKIIFLHYWTGALSGGIDQMVDTFNRDHPSYRVRATGFEHETFKVSIRAMLAAGHPPDLFSYWAGARVQAIVDAGHLSPIDDLWAQAGLDRLFSPLVAGAATYNGSKYIIPVTQHYICFFYNKSIFSRYGLQPPTTWEAFLSVCEKLVKKAGISPIALGSRERWPAQYWFDHLMLRTAAPEFRERLMNGNASYTDPAVKKTFDLWKTLLDKHYFNPTPNLYDWSEAAKMVFHGKAAMTLMGTWAIGLFDGQLGWRQESDYDFFAFPLIDPAIPTVSMGPLDAIVLPAEGNLKAARKTLRYFTDEAPQKAMSKGSGALSPSQQVPPEFYTPLQRRIRKAIADSALWVTPYDLATPPAAAESGLNLFSRFLDNPEQVSGLLKATEKEMESLFKGE